MHGRKRLSPEEAEVRRKKELMRVEQYRVICDEFDALKGRVSLMNAQQLVDVTRKLLALNPEYYTAWNERRRALGHLLESDTRVNKLEFFQHELQFNMECIKIHPKSYWVFNHRRWLIETHPKPRPYALDLKAVDKLLMLDSRNFHGWDYRRWLIAQMNVDETGETCRDVASEIRFTYDKICQNFSNYSAWHYRSKLIDTAELLDDFEMIKNAVYTEPKDQSAWLYHRWLTEVSSTPDLIPTRVIVFPGLDENDCWWIMILFDVPVKMATSSAMSAAITHDDTTWKIVWRSAEGKRNTYNHCWFAAIPSYRRTFRIEASCFMRRDGTLSSAVDVELDLETNECRLEKQMGLAQQDVLKSELNMVEELLDLEPDCKWALVRAAQIYLRIKEYSKARTLMKQLREGVDSDRSGYYSYLESQIKMMETRIFDARWVSDRLSSQTYQTLVNQLPVSLNSIKSLDLSGAQLKSLRKLACFVYLEELTLDDNQLECLDGIRVLKCLKKLDIRNNNLRDIVCLEQLVALPRLGALDLRGNPLCSMANYHSQVSRCAPQLQIFDGERTSRAIDRADFRWMTKACHQAFMSGAVDTAFCVGAVITDDETGKCLTTGFSRELEGNTHAEEVALIKMSDSSSRRSLTLYTTMEPCVRRLSGKDPCVELILESAAVKRVVYGVREPETFVQNDTGLSKLTEAGIEVSYVPFEAEVRIPNNHHKDT